MSIDKNEKAMNCMNNLVGSMENKIRAIYNYGFKDGYEKGLEEAYDKIKDSIMKQVEEWGDEK